MILRQGDTGTTLSFQVRKGSQPVVLTGATLTFEGKRFDGTTFGGSCAITDAINGRFTYTVSSPDTSIPGVHKFSVRIQFDGSTITRLPRLTDGERFEVLPLEQWSLRITEYGVPVWNSVRKYDRHTISGALFDAVFRTVPTIESY